ncbi:Retaining alpha-galactosidase precursor [Sedimentisphaera cyanobacteriorum]|uniref:Retaining alpha-galactosidase n=1 Tax=Sedimentisphaera cyanobacteriorum TaxID=1940790 RepID=A0A1Q2HNV4_9BACT|nr:glycoside hydrolase family 97 protein [Sedimentisphaera cyanobacteriorum]AQQ08925.1 Retaining alpha-galactosidase precursor [Sedimentisphaera cyanobacteriorum]
MCLLRFAFLVFASALISNIYAETYKVHSPDDSVQISVEIDKDIQWSVKAEGKQILLPSKILLNSSRGVLGSEPDLISQNKRSISRTLKPAVREKRREIKDNFQEITLNFRQGWSLVFRAYEDGAAYRFKTDFDGEQIIKSETAEFNFPKDHKLYFPEEKSMITHQEREYLHTSLSKIDSDRFCSIPALIAPDNSPKVVLTESDLRDYPGFYLQGSGAKSFEAVFPKFVLDSHINPAGKGDRVPVIDKRADYIAKTGGTRAFPWRVVGIAKEDEDLIDSQLVWKLASPCELEDTSWIKPGKVAWDWYNANNIFGVDFDAGVNTKTYKYFIDFASEHGLDYIILDEGWYVLKDLTAPAEDMNLPELFSYAEKKDVGIILWMTWHTLNQQFEEVMPMFEKWGAEGLKVDFMQRDDQWMVNFYEKVAKDAAERHMLVDFHGSYKPAGLRRAYPNVITREGVRGGEQNKWSERANPEHNITLPFTRMYAGPVDYTPGAMVNAQKENFAERFERPMSLGTRCHQLAMYVIFESPLQMLCDSPSLYKQEPECMEFLSAVPTVWDETEVLDAKVAEYALTARKSGEEWYLGAMTDWSERQLEADLSFLGKGSYTAHIWKDGANAERYASDFAYIKKEVTRKDTLKINLAPGGGFAARFILR